MEEYNIHSKVVKDKEFHIIDNKKFVLHTVITDVKSINFLTYNNWYG